jgi:hypothetical protein
MKKVLSGHRYDTDKAKLISTFIEDGLSPEDETYYEERLFKTKAGLFFLYGKGNAGSPYSVPSGIGWKGSEEIRPLDDADAQAWIDAKVDMDADMYEDIFGAPSEKIKISADLSEADKAKFDALKRSKNMSAGELISWMVERCSDISIV